MSDQVTPQAQHDSSASGQIYFERVWPSLGMWVFLLGMSASLGIAYAQPFGATTGWLTFAVLGTAIAIGLIINSPVIQVTQSDLVVGRAKLPILFVGKVQTLDANATKLARSTNAHPDAYFNLRGGVSETVIVEVTDIDDPHPYWQFSTRHPEQLVAAIESVLKTRI